MSHCISVASLQPGALVGPGGPTALALESNWKHSRQDKTDSANGGAGGNWADIQLLGVDIFSDKIFFAIALGIQYILYTSYVFLHYYLESPLIPLQEN